VTCAHEQVAETEPFRAFHAEHGWEPYVYVGDGYKVMAFRRADKAGHVVPSQDGERWWPSWSHPYLCGRAGWHHNAFGAYSSKESAAMAFDQVYDLERIAGNLDRMTREDADLIRAEHPGEPSPTGQIT
jgi:hypothetical protein